MCSYIIQPCMHASNHPTTPSTRYDILGKSTSERGNSPGEGRGEGMGMDETLRFWRVSVTYGGWWSFRINIVGK